MTDIYDSSIPAEERTYHQLHAMLSGSNVTLNNFYALASFGGTKTVDEVDAIAKQAVKDKLDALKYTTLPEPCTYPHTGRFSP